MRAWHRVDAAGTAVDLTETAGHQLLQEWGLNATDMRVLATHRRMHNTSLTLTKTYICIRYGAVAIAATDSCSLLSDSGHESSGVVHEVCRRLRSYMNFMHLEGDRPSLSVQHVVADTVLDLCMIDFSTKQVALENEIDFHLMQLEKRSTEVDLFELRSCKTRLNRLSTSIDSLRSVLADLQTDCCAEATSSMLIAYHDQADDLVQHLRILGDRVGDTEALAGLRSDQQRNQILRFELLVILLGLSISVISAASGALGMNHI
ncbi:g523 [Coccomyxa elongata]